MRIIVDEIPKKASDCMFSKDVHTDYSRCSFGNHGCLEKCTYLKSIKDYHAENEKYIGDGYNSHEEYPLVDSRR